MKCCELTAGQLRHSITFQKKIQLPDDGGGFVVTTTDVTAVRAKLKPVSASERFFSQRIETNTSHKIFIRYNKNINSSMRIKLGDRYFQIDGIVNLEERNKWLEISATEGESTW